MKSAPQQVAGSLRASREFARNLPVWLPLRSKASHERTKEASANANDRMRRLADKAPFPVSSSVAITALLFSLVANCASCELLSRAAPNERFDGVSRTTGE